MNFFFFFCWYHEPYHSSHDYMAELGAVNTTFAIAYFKGYFITNAKKGCSRYITAFLRCDRLQPSISQPSHTAPFLHLGTLWTNLGCHGRKQVMKCLSYGMANWWPMHFIVWEAITFCAKWSVWITWSTLGEGEWSTDNISTANFQWSGLQYIQCARILGQYCRI